MVDILPIVISSIVKGSLYALVAVGFTLIFGVGGVLNLAHGATITIGAYAAYLIGEGYALGAPGAIAGAIIVPGLFGALMYIVLIRRVQDDPVIVMIMTLIASIGVESLIGQIGPSGQQPQILVSGNTPEVLGVSVQYHELLIVFVSLALIGALFLYVNRTDTGRAILATSQDRKGAFLVGIDSSRINLWMWVLASVLAGIAGLFLIPSEGLSADMGLWPLIFSFAIVILGGLGSIRGSVVGAYVIGTVEVMTTSLVDPKLTGLTPLLLLLVVLFVRPSGLFGQEVQV
ncbi:branched-chain amino acid ABC transporter permease [Halorientalis salina]|uniref:branched-chain amino acid ABC transporter permease n=1 Tax=Halorientalis salina TaxID=2932266 RepID=UPI0010AC335C|nr:branched-chain amino acid ABC transporter permease [Halorientalis salina]